MQLRVIIKRLNKRRFIPGQLPEPTGIAGQVLDGYTFEGEEVNMVEVPDPGIGSWYKDRDGYYYWGGGVAPLGIAFAREFAEEEVAYPWWMQQLGIPEIWSIYNERGANAKVAVLDSGYNVNNSEIKDAVHGEFVDPAFPASVTINDVLGHGSYCSSIIGARNTIQVIGSAPECQLYIAKVTSRGTFDNQKIKNAIQWAVSQGVDIISLSIGGDKSDEINELIRKAVQDKNIIVIAAIGNNENPGTSAEGGEYPALYEHCIAVGATDKANNLSDVTLINDKTEINAPGEDILGYTLGSAPGILPTGTSQATAIVAGICALIVSRHRSINKNYTAESIKELLRNNSTPVVNAPGQIEISPVQIFSKI